MTGIAGLWLALTGLLGFSHLGYLVNNVIVGVTVLITGFGLATMRPWHGVLAGSAGVWVFISAFIHGLQSGGAALWNNLLAGALIAIAGLTAAAENNRGMAGPKGS